MKTKNFAEVIAKKYPRVVALVERLERLRRLARQAEGKRKAGY